MIPLVHDFAGETVLIFGGGAVGARRARTFDDARVVVVSPRFAEDEFGGAILVRAKPGPDDVSGWIDRVVPALVVAATDDDEVNEAIATATDDAGALLNRTDRSGGGPRQVDVPAIVRDGPVVASVSTGGTSPSLSGELRGKVADAIDGSGELASVVGLIRTDLDEEGLTLDQRRDALRAVVEDEDVWRAARDGRDAEPVAREVVDRVVDSGGRDSSGGL